MPSDVAEFVIKGVTMAGDVFQPADWAERLCNSLDKTAPDGSKIRSPYVHPVVSDGIKSVVVQVALQKADPAAFEMIKRYIAENHLMVRAGRGTYIETTGAFPAFGRERRDPEHNT